MGNLSVRHLIPAAEAPGFWVYIPVAKNDRYGKGNRTFIPSIREAQDADPFIVISTYLAALRSWGKWAKQNGVPALRNWQYQALFPIFKGPSAGACMSDRSVRMDIEVLLKEIGVEAPLPSYRKGGAVYYALADRQLAFIQGTWQQKDMLNLVYAPVGPREQAERVQRAAWQLHVDIVLEFILREMQKCIITEDWSTIKVQLVPKMSRSSIPPTVQTSRALVLCPDLRRLFEIDDIVLPAFVCAWFCGKVRTATGNVVRDTASVRVSSDLKSFVKKNHVLIPAVGGIKEHGGICTNPVVPLSSPGTCFGTPASASSSSSSSGAKRTELILNSSSSSSSSVKPGKKISSAKPVGEIPPMKKQRR
ncbi:MAG: hypothetical protein CL799_09640 [Chromatiales bacterium]|nr:hypothetical protein [Chromatiales bacterium]